MSIANAGLSHTVYTDVDFVAVWNTIKGYANAHVYYWQGIQDPTIGQVDGQPAGTTRWAAYGYAFFDPSGASGMALLTVRAEGLGNASANITGISGITQLSSGINVAPSFTPF